METLLFDTLMHRSLLRDPPQWQARLYTEFDGQDVEGSAIALPLTEHVESRGEGLEALAAPEVPNYAAVIQHVTGALRWDPREFVVFRLRIRFPPISTQVLLTCPVKRTLS